MISLSQLKKGANFRSLEFDEKIIIVKETPKMIWYVAIDEYGAEDKVSSDKRTEKIGFLVYLNACGFKII